MGARRERMVKHQIERRGVRDRAVLKAMRDVTREVFVPEELRVYAYEDGPLPIGHGQTISQAFIVATMAEALDLEPGDRVLEDREGFYGLDLNSLYTSVGAVLDYLDDVDPDAACVARYACLEPFEHDPAAYGRTALTGGYRDCEKGDRVEPRSPAGEPAAVRHRGRPPAP